MNNMCVVRSLSLPQRLFYCLFHPLLLIFFTSIILTIWSTFSVIDITMAKTYHTKTEWNNTVVTSVSISTATTTATETSVTTYQPSYSTSFYTLNDSYIEERIDQYFESKLRNISSVVNTDMQAKFESYTDDLLNDKQQLITDHISSQTESIKSVLELNNTIFNELLAKSHLINVTWSEISEDAMTLDQDSISQLAQNLFLNSSMFDNVFQNYSSRLEFLQAFNDTITDFPIQLSDNNTLNLSYLQTSADWVQLRQNFTRNLQSQISILSGNTTNTKSSASITKRSINNNSEENSDFIAIKRKVFYRCQKMTIVFTVLYFALVVLLMIVERIKFQLENQQFNLVISQINDSTGCTNFTQYNNILKNLITTLNLSALYPVVYQLTKLINQKILKRNAKESNERKAKRSKLFYCNWWLFSNGVYLWIFGLLMILIHWQIASRLTSFSVADPRALNKRSEPLSYKRELWADVNMTTAVDGVINDSINLLCANFQLDINERFLSTHFTFQADPSLRAQSMEILSSWGNATNTQFEKYLNDSSQNWQKTDVQIEPLLSTDSVTVFMNQYSVPLNRVAGASTSLAIDIQKYGIIIKETNVTNNSVATLSSLGKRLVEKQEPKQKNSPSSHNVFKWGVLIACLIILLHHLLTFIIIRL
ncbi:pheromone-regulated protein PRM2 [Saccharomyces eubayanus]|uniref:pheromone-regulated protein PRM2 n=1 Tax=Saccharomyces eubayanus TaxID=1080349 RepID=UPI0006C6D7EA|nr:PRM2-like protein [Saccharomyces eubayanus]KOG98855.1 PRM2-like protein [Saccharomyces eubayanus]